MSSALLADVVTAAHLAVVVFLLVMLFAVPVGGVCRWRWVRNPALRMTHLAIMGYIVFNAARGELCCLTHWEMDLRRAAGQASGEDYSFVGRLLHDILFVDVDQSVLHWIYAGVGLLVLAGLFLVPPHRRAGEAGLVGKLSG
ncbi:MAG: DUF2784 domain-containing protein [Planctomycetota bacterium]|nr:DUF2784 domain-containing protein [Planctomycetota bacterium]